MATQSALARSHPPEYRRHRPEATLLYQVIEEYWPEFQIELAGRGKSLPAYITKEFEEYLKCGRLEHGFLRVRCESCHDEKLVAFSGPLLRIPAPAAFVNPFTSQETRLSPRGAYFWCPSCGARRMADSAALLVEEILPHQPMRQLTPGMACSRAMQEQLPRVLSVPFPLRFLFASHPAVIGQDDPVPRSTGMCESGHG